MLKESYPYYVGGRPERPNTDLVVTDKYTGRVAARVAQAGPDAVRRAADAAVRAAEPMRRMHAYERQAVLQHCVDRFRQRAEELAHVLCVEAGKPIRDARGEVGRLIDTFRIAAEESVRIYGEVMPMDITPRAAAYTGMWKRVPVGPCLFITPFNFPLNLCAHKVAPALACGCPFVLKPASATPIGALIIGEVLAEAELPPGAFSIVTCSGKDASTLVEDDRIRLLSFTGSGAVGWDLKRRAGRKHVLLELGGNAAVVIDRDADLDDAVRRLVFGAFYQSGQSCISVQRIIVHDSVYEPVRDRLVAATRQLKMGDPRQEDTFIGPMISEAEAVRLESWINAARDRGATVLCGGRRQGALLEATLLENVPDDAEISCKEAFGPVAVLSRFTEFDEALEAVNASAYGLQAGVFTRDIFKAYRAWDRLDVGGVVINDVPSFRVDHMPYGGVKESGSGREGIRFAIEHMTEIRLMIVRLPNE